MPAVSEPSPAVDVGDIVPQERRSSSRSPERDDVRPAIQAATSKSGCRAFNRGDKFGVSTGEVLEQLTEPELMLARQHLLGLCPGGKENPYWQRADFLANRRKGRASQREALAEDFR